MQLRSTNATGLDARQGAALAQTSESNCRNANRLKIGVRETEFHVPQNVLVTNSCASGGFMYSARSGWSE